MPAHVLRAFSSQMETVMGYSSHCVLLHLRQSDTTLLSPVLYEFSNLDADDHRGVEQQRTLVLRRAAITISNRASSAALIQSTRRK